MLYGNSQRPNLSFRLVAGWAAMAALPISVASTLLFVASAEQAERLYRPELLISIGSDGAEAFRWAAVTDMIGSYLLFAPLLVYLSIHFRPRNEISLLYGAAGFGACLLGGGVAAGLAAAGSDLIVAFETSADKAAIAAAFRGLTEFGITGVWQTWDPILFGISLAGFGSLIRTRRKALGYLSMASGLISIAAGIGRGTGLSLETIDPNGLLVIPILSLPLVIPFWFGIHLVRGDPLSLADDLEHLAPQRGDVQLPGGVFSER